MRLIDAEKLAEYKASGVSDLTEWQKGWNDAIDTIIGETPTVDAVKAVRCKDCRWQNTSMCWITNKQLLDDYDFCCGGLRREDAETN